MKRLRKIHYTHHAARQAFTLIELLTVIAIIGMLSTVAVIATGSSREKAKLAAGQSLEASIQHAVGSEIVGEWLFDEASGAVASDTSGNGRGGAITGATRVAGMNGGALHFTAGSYVTLGSDEVLNPSNFTITAWVKPGNFTGPYGYIYSNSRDCCGSYNGISFEVSYNKLYGAIWNGPAFYLSSNGTISNDPVWTFVAMSYNGNKMSLYINGKLDNVAISTLGVGSPASAAGTIGAMGLIPSYGIDGTIDQVRLYGGAIIAADIERIYLAEKQSFVVMER